MEDNRDLLIDDELVDKAPATRKVNPTLQRILDLKEEMEDKLNSAEMWRMGSDSWQDLADCDNTCETYERFVKYLEEMEVWFDR